MRAKEPDNLIRLQLENYIDFFTVYITEDEAVFEALEKNKDNRIAIIKDSGLDNSPYFLYLQANIRLHWALARLKFEEYYTAFLEVNKAFKLLEANEEKFPRFLPNKKDLGILHAMVGTIPDNYKWGVELLTSLNGTIHQGKSEIEAVIKNAQTNQFTYEVETLVLYSYLLMHLENDAETAWSQLKSGKLNPKTSLLACFTLANVAMRTGRNDEAISILENRPGGKDYFEFPYLDFMLGTAKLRRLDQDSDQYFHRFLDRFHGRHFIKEAYQKLAWSALMKGNNTLFETYRKKVLSKGNLVVGGDKNAEQDAKSNYIPDLTLLKARLLFDGGYYKKAYEQLLAKTSSEFTGQRGQLEFTYRMGRILHKMGKTNEAIRYYSQTIEEGRNAPYYFACNAALQAGLLFESVHNTKAALQYFDVCTNIHPEEHKTALHQQAKAGMERIKETSH
ncbi:MAG: hypothetical protein KDC24_05640 [Saprospiraceae bacterium]|nr:hypothetical protein [Saprospiraceae bacterium]